MSYQQYDRSGPYGAYGHNTGPPRRPPPPAGYYPPPDRPRGQAPMRPARPGNQPPLDWRRQPRMPPPVHQYPSPVNSSENLYDGSAFGGAEYETESEAWPLPARPFAQQQRSRSPNSSGSPRRPPQRPRRPDYEDPGFDLPRSAGRPSPRNRPGPPPLPPPPLPVSQPRHYQHSHHGSGEWTDDGYIAPPPNPPQDYRLPATQYTPSSIPDFPAPVTAQNVASALRNQRAPLGPPPSSRRGPASYYPQIAPVHPIAEEADSMRGSIRNAQSMAGLSAAGGHDSYASSGTMPGSIPDYYLEHRDSAPALPGAIPRDAQGLPREESGMYESETDDARGPSPDPVSIVRQASLGKKSKPTLTTVKSGERIKPARSGDALLSLPSQQKPSTTLEPTSSLAKEMHLPENRASDLSEYSDDNDRFDLEEKMLEAGMTIAGADALYNATTERPEDRESARKSSKDILRSGTGLIDPSSSESDHAAVPSRDFLGADLAHNQQQPFPSRPRSPLSSSSDNAIPPTGLSDRAGMRRPPRLNVDAVREAEARGSLTSLSELIKRATRLASNLDRGKTASRLGMGFFDGTDSENEKIARALQKHQQRQSGGAGSFTDILAAFPASHGMLATPPGSRGGWPSHLRHSALPSDSDAGEKKNRKRRDGKRRCCGLPLWIFLLLLLLLFLLVAAAVVVPVILLVVLPNRDNHSKNAAAVESKALAQCKSQLSCANGGTNILRSASSSSSSPTTTGTGNAPTNCMCLCVNGYTGSTCSSHDPSGCSTTSVGSVADATLGEDIPALLAAAQTNFSLPLDAQTVLGLFSQSDMTCQTENALVTFEDVPATLITRDNTTAISSTNSTSGSPGITATSISQEVEFAKVAVLYVFQTTASLNDAITAQDNFQSFFTRGENVDGVVQNATAVNLGVGVVVDLIGLEVVVNGTVVT